MSDNTHDPPVTTPTLVPTLPGYQPEPALPPETLAALRGPGLEKYALMRDRLGGQEPIEVIRLMKRGGFRYKSRRGMPGNIVTDKAGEPVPDRMSFRQIAPILAGMSGVEVAYETVRRWWEAAFPGEQDEPDEEDLREASQIVVDAQFQEDQRRRTVRRRTSAKVVPVGDDAADAIRAAMDRAKSTNPAIPPAAFVAPVE